MANKPINLMPDFEMKSANIFHGVTAVPVFLNPDPKAKEVYLSGGHYEDDSWVSEYALTGVGLSILADAAGMHSESHRIDDRSHPHICEMQCTVKWMQPDGIELSRTMTYLLDLRDWVDTSQGKIRAPRYDQSFLKERDSILSAKLKRGSNNKNPKKSDIDSAYASLDEKERETIDKTADASAYRSIMDMRPHILRRAETGAFDAAIRKIMKLKGSYTKEELLSGFVVYRTRFDKELMVDMLGAQAVKNLAMMAAAKLLNVSEDRAVALLSSGSSGVATSVQDDDETRVAIDSPDGSQLIEHQETKLPETWSDVESLATKSGVTVKEIGKYLKDKHGLKGSKDYKPEYGNDVVEFVNKTVSETVELEWREKDKTAKLTDNVDWGKDAAFVTKACEWAGNKEKQLEVLSEYGVATWHKLTIKQALDLWSKIK